MPKESQSLQKGVHDNQRETVKLLKALTDETSLSLVFSLYIAKKSVSTGLFLSGLQKVGKLTGKSHLEELRKCLENLKTEEFIKETETPWGTIYELTDEGMRIFDILSGDEKQNLRSLIMKIKAELSELIKK